MRALLLCALFASVAGAEDDWVGKKYLPRAEAKFWDGDRESDPETISLPFEITSVDDQWLYLGRCASNTMM